jgi:hypothetical protein
MSMWFAVAVTPTMSLPCGIGSVLGAVALQRAGELGKQQQGRRVDPPADLEGTLRLEVT